MDKLIEKYPCKKILYLNWYEAAIGHLLLFKHYIDKYSQNVYFLISEQGVTLKATTVDFLKKADQEITKFFTAKIQQLELSGSSDFYNNLLEDIKQQTDKLKDARDCPYINLVYSEKLRNSCLAMKKHGYTKPYENWQCHQRQRKGFCFLIVRPEHRWKQIAANVYELARKRYPSHAKQTTEITWPVKICYEKFIWFFLKQSFKNFKKSLQIKDNKADKCLTIVIKNQISQLNDLEKEIQSLTFSYLPRRPNILDTSSENKVIILSTLDIERITQLVYHQFGLTSFAKQLRKKMSGFLAIGSVDIGDHLQNIDESDLDKRALNLKQKQDIICINNKKLGIIINKLGRRHSIVNYEGSNFVQLKIQKPIRENYQKILNLRLPCLPRYYYWYETQKNYFLLRSYINHKFSTIFQKSKTYDQLYLLYSLLCIVDEFSQKNIFVGAAIHDCIFVDQKRVIIQPDQNGSKQQDNDRLRRAVEDYIQLIKQDEVKHEIKSALVQSNYNPLGLIEYLQDFLDFGA